MITLNTLTLWLSAPAETEHLEFKEAKQQFDTTKLLRYCVALANEGGGHLVLGVSDKPPRRIVGTQAFAAASALNEIKARIVEKLRIRVDTVELAHSDGRVLVFEVPFCLPESKAATVSLVISAAKDAGLIKADESETTSTRYARYLPFWA